MRKYLVIAAIGIMAFTGTACLSESMRIGLGVAALFEAVAIIVVEVLSFLEGN